jgi:prepilin-type N-terminal cleavage/methylation domain-containing protein
MIRLRASRFGGQAYGFSLVELLIAMAICALLSAAVAGVVAPSREAFEQTPAALDLQQRGRTAIETLSYALRSAGANVGATVELGPLSEVVPAVILSNPDPSGVHFTRLLAIMPKTFAAQGTLAVDQDGPAGSLSLADAHCPNVADVCGFVAGTSAVIADGTGRFDIFVVSSANAASRRLAADRAFSQPYPAGSVVVEADAYIFRLDEATGSFVRETAAGAVQPIVDAVVEIAFEPYGATDDDVARIEVPVLQDGPWWHGGPDDEYDDDWFRVRRIDVRLRLTPREVPHRPGADQTFRAAITLRNVR